MDQISFSKLSGAGNDFIVIDNRQNIVPKSVSNFVAKVCARRVSAGADGLLLVENSDVADFKMRYFNSDGGEVETCGNGARCIARSTKSPRATRRCSSAAKAERARNSSPTRFTIPARVTPARS